MWKVEPVILRFHRKPKRNLWFETELPVSTSYENDNSPGTRIEEKSHIIIKTAICKHNFGVKVTKKPKLDHEMFKCKTNLETENHWV